MAHKHIIQRTGFLLSLLCAIHCLATPLLITSLPFLGSTLSETVEMFLVVGSLALGIWLLYRDFRIHKVPTPFVYFIVGGLLQITGVFFFRNFETVLGVAGGVLVIISYYKNWVWHKRVCHSH